MPSSAAGLRFTDAVVVLAVDHGVVDVLEVD
jgi:hypothetical protein